MKSHPSRVQVHPNEDDIESRADLTLGERVATFLRLIYPSKTAINVSVDTHGRIPVATVKTWLQRSSPPDAEGFNELWLTYGPDFLAAAAGQRSPEWVKDLRRLREAADLAAEIAALETKLARVRA